MLRKWARHYVEPFEMKQFRSHFHYDYEMAWIWRRMLSSFLAWDWKGCHFECSRKDVASKTKSKYFLKLIPWTGEFPWAGTCIAFQFFPIRKLSVSLNERIKLKWDCSQISLGMTIEMFYLETYKNFCLNGYNPKSVLTISSKRASKQNLSSYRHVQWSRHSAQLNL